MWKTYRNKQGSVYLKQNKQTKKNTPEIEFMYLFIYSFNSVIYLFKKDPDSLD